MKHEMVFDNIPMYVIAGNKASLVNSVRGGVPALLSDYYTRPVPLTSLVPSYTKCLTPSSTSEDPFAPQSSPPDNLGRA